MYERELRVIDANIELIERLTQRIRAYALTTWGSLGSWRDADIDRFVARVLPSVLAAQKQARDLTFSYLDTLSRLAGYAPPARQAVEVGSALHKGVALAEVYRRPATTAWVALSEGKTIEEAIALGSQRLDAIIAIEMQLAQTSAAHAWTRENKTVTGYRRVLTGRESCGICALASTRVYYKSDLMPIHAFCDCKVAPIFGDHDPYEAESDARYDAVMQLMDEQGIYSKKDYSAINLVEHGEYGPMIEPRSSRVLRRE